MCAILISEAVRLARVNEELQFYPHGYPLPSRRASPHFGRYSFPSAEGRRLSWPGWLGDKLRWLARPKTVTHPVLAVAAGNRTLDVRVASPTPCKLTTRLPIHEQRCPLLVKH